MKVILLTSSLSKKMSIILNTFISTFLFGNFYAFFLLCLSLSLFGGRGVSRACLYVGFLQGITRHIYILPIPSVSTDQ